MTTTITTNNHARPMCSWSEIPEDERPELDFGADPHAEGYFKAYGRWHMLFDFIVITKGDGRMSAFGHHVDEASPLAEWEAIATDSAFSGIAIRYPREGYEHDPYGYVIAGYVTIT